MKQKTLQKEGGPGISLNPTCTQGDSLLLSVSTIVSEECPLTKECPPPTVREFLSDAPFSNLVSGECMKFNPLFTRCFCCVQVGLALYKSSAKTEISEVC